jgi:hypothetical protein
MQQALRASICSGLSIFISPNQDVTRVGHKPKIERANARPFNLCSTDTSRWRSARLWLHLVHRASSNKGGSSSPDMGACSLLPLVCPSLSCNSHAPYRSADYNRVQNRKTNSKFPQETVSDVVFPEWGSLKDRGKDTMDGCRAAFSNSLRVMSLPCTPKQSRLILQEAGVTTRGTAGC